MHNQNLSSTYSLFLLKTLETVIKVAKNWFIFFFVHHKNLLILNDVNWNNVLVDEDRCLTKQLFNSFNFIIKPGKYWFPIG